MGREVIGSCQFTRPTVVDTVYDTPFVCPRCARRLERTMKKLLGSFPELWNWFGHDGVLETFTQSHPRVPQDCESPVRWMENHNCTYSSIYFARQRALPVCSICLLFVKRDRLEKTDGIVTAASVGIALFFN